MKKKILVVDDEDDILHFLELVLKEKGYEVPKTMEELLALTDKIVADGGTPWCIGIESGGASGWVATDWMEDLMLRTQPPEVYDNPNVVQGDRMVSAGKVTYHQGIEWNFPHSFLVKGELKYGNPDAAFEYVRPQVKGVLSDGAVGGLSEQHDALGPRGPDTQTWSMSNFIQSLHAAAGSG